MDTAHAKGNTRNMHPCAHAGAPQSCARAWPNCLGDCAAAGDPCVAEHEHAPVVVVRRSWPCSRALGALGRLGRLGRRGGSRAVVGGEALLDELLLELVELQACRLVRVRVRVKVRVRGRAMGRVRIRDRVRTSRVSPWAGAGAGAGVGVLVGSPCGTRSPARASR